MPDISLETHTWRIRLKLMQHPSRRGHHSWSSVQPADYKIMVRIYSYELWNGKSVLGYYSTLFIIMGKSITIYEESALKQIYGQKMKIIEVPLTIRCVKNDGIECTYRTVLDVRKKSKRQINILLDKKNNHIF